MPNFRFVSLPASDLYKNSAEVEAAFLAVPEECVAEILDGELHVQPRPRVRHARATSRLGGDLSGFDREGAGGPGVSHLWLVSPDQRVLEVFRLQGEHWVLLDTFEGDSAVRAEPFDAIELPLGSLWEL